LNPHRLAIKLFVAPDPTAPVALEPFTPLFHEFIQKASVPGLLVDVADYAHVPNGPGIILIGHDVEYGIDSVGGRTGLLVVRKGCGQASLAEATRDTLARAFACAKAIEDDGRTGIVLSPSTIELQALDRLAAPNQAGTFQLMREETGPVFEQILGDCSIERTHEDDPRKSAALVVRSSADLDHASLLARLGGS
jgi:hypothetical protein